MRVNSYTPPRRETAPGRAIRLGAELIRGVVAEVRANSHAQGKVSGRADCWHIVVEVAKHRAVVHVNARGEA